MATPPPLPAKPQRNIMLVGLAALLPVVAFAAFAVVSTLAAHRDADDERLRDTARALAGAVDMQLGTVVATLEALAASPLLDDPEDAPAFEARVRSKAERLGGWLVLVAQPPAHRMLANTLRHHGAPLPEALPEEAREALAPPLSKVFEAGQPGVSDLFVAGVAGQPVLTVIVPVEREGQPRRALALGFEPRTLHALLERSGVPAGIHATITDGKGRVVAHTADPVGRLLGTPAPGTFRRAGEDRRQGLVAGPGLNGGDDVHAVERLALAPGWTVAASEPLNLQRAQTWRLVQWQFGGAAALAAGLMIVALATRREAARDRDLRDAALRTGRAEIERLHKSLPAIIFLARIRVRDGALQAQRVYRGGDVVGVTGWSAEALAGMHTLEPVSDYGGVPMAERFRDVLTSGEGQWEWRLRRPDGSWSWMRTRAIRLGGFADGSAEVVGYNFNIDREREAEARAIASARLASIGEMAAGMAHELKQPLQSISLAAEIGQFAAQQGYAAEADSWFERIIEHSHRTSGLIDSLRRFSRGAEDASEPIGVPLDLPVQAVLRLTSSALRDASISLEIALGDPVPVVRAQPVLLEQVLSNLLLNARDALAGRPAGERRTIRIAACAGPDGTVEITVADTGGGIAPEVMARLFEPFVTTKGPDRGTGLGLSICHGLVKSMGGSIKARNDADGAVFSITLRAAALDGSTQASAVAPASSAAM